MKRAPLTICLLLLLTGLASGAAVQYYSYPDAAALPDNARLLMYDPALGSLNITGLLLKQILNPAQVNADWNAASGAAQILNKPAIPAPQVNSDWSASNGLAQILNKPAIPVLCGADPSTAIFDGARGPQGPSIFCNISAPVQAFGYDTGGLNPSPALKAFGVQLWEGAVRVAVQAYQWWTGGPGNSVSGSGSASTFTPTVAALFNNRSTNNRVAVQVKYSTALGGNRYCRASIPIAVTKPGAKGDKGDTGDAAITKAGIVANFTAATAGGNAMLFFPSAGQGDSALQIGVGDTLANLRLKILPTGLLMIIRPDGKYDFMYDTATRSLRLGNYSTTSSRSNYKVDYLGQVWKYAPSGKLIFWNSTSGRTKWYNADTGALMRYLDRDGTVTDYLSNGVTPRVVFPAAGGMVL